MGPRRGDAIGQRLEVPPQPSGSPFAPSSRRRVERPKEIGLNERAPGPRSALADELSAQGHGHDLGPDCRRRACP